MNQEVHIYESVKFPENVCDMFADMVLQDIVLKDVFLFIAERFQTKEYATITTISENIVISRRVGHREKKTLKYEVKNMNIERKTTQKLVDQLYFMSLIYIQPKLPYKEILLTPRGIQVVLRVTEKLKNKNSI
ncbi:hypothetical protein D7X33_20465 [Butyricicoccus sp. 1XD8-22]|nr:hypothetical protein D7X33_20465 [Butyricicoccus sp. 1XD8-22]